MKKLFEEPTMKTVLINDVITVDDNIIPGSSTQDPEEW